MRIICIMKIFLTFIRYFAKDLVEKVQPQRLQLQKLTCLHHLVKSPLFCVKGLRTCSHTQPPFSALLTFPLLYLNNPLEPFTKDVLLMDEFLDPLSLRPALSVFKYPLLRMPTYFIRKSIQASTLSQNIPRQTDQVAVRQSLNEIHTYVISNLSIKYYVDTSFLKKFTQIVICTKCHVV